MDVGAYGRVGVWAVVLLMVGLALSGCATPAPPPAPPTPTPKPPSAEKPSIGGVTIREGEIAVSDQQGRPLWKATGENIESDEKGGVATFTKAKCQLFDAGKLTLNFQADTIAVNYDAKPPQIDLKGNVVAQSPTTGWRFRAPAVTAIYNDKRIEKISAERDVHMEKGNLKIQGVGMTVDVSLKRVSFDDAISVLALREKRSGQR
jgi:LPS export ABC transporter protein LptC